jgi:aminoglycoside N3'-acetyltransferase
MFKNQISNSLILAHLTKKESKYLFVGMGYFSVFSLHLFNYIALKELLHEYQSKRGKAPPNPNLSLFNSG